MIARRQPVVRPHKLYLEQIHFGSRVIDISLAIKLANSEIVHPETRAALEDAVNIQQRRGLLMAFGCIS